MPNPVQVDVDNITPRKSEVEILQLLTSFHSLYFFITGVEGNIQLRTADGTTALIHDGDDAIYFVGITSSTAIESIQWRSHDGTFRIMRFRSSASARCCARTCHLAVYFDRDALDYAPL